MTNSITFEDFTKDVANHVLIINKEDEKHRHIVCVKPGTNIQRFEIVTFPGYLVYVGDMGSYTFWRTEDMFTFFRSKDGAINPGYWAEKVEAEDHRDGLHSRSFDVDDEPVVSQRFLWCCYAIVWAINRYDEQKAKLA